MKGIFVFFTGVVLLICFSSCQKEIDWGFANTTHTDSIYVTRFIELDTTYPAGMDTSYKTLYSYDSKKRIKDVAEIGFDDGTHNTGYTLGENRFYSANDSVPFKIVRSEWFSNGDTFLDTVYLYYNSNNVIIRDSSLYYMNGTKIKIRVSGFGLIGSNRYLVLETTIDPNTGMTVKDSILSQRNWTLLGVLFNVSMYSFTFDNNRNPFFRTILPYPVYLNDYYHTTHPFYYPLLATANNPLTHFQDHSIMGGGTFNYSGTARYVYNSLGYPVIIRYTSTALSNPHKGLVYYTAL
jgi:hypothetical protein